MLYFNDFPKIQYKFGNEIDLTLAFTEFRALQSQDIEDGF